MIQTLSWQPSAVLGIGRSGRSNVVFKAVTHSKEHVFGKVQIATLFTVVFQNMGFHNGIHRAAFFAKAAKNALGEVNVVARGAT
jgi:hypothetical protein